MPSRTAARRTLELPLEQALRRLPLTALRRAGLERCAGCAMARFETVGEAARTLSRDPMRVARLLLAARREEDP